MALAAKTTVGNYEIVASIGAGGMGEVYRAQDTKLERDVAIKVLPGELARDKERLARFEREARVLARLNHTNIGTIHGLEEHAGQPLLVMELVEGETLAERIARGPLTIEDVIPLFVQIAEGLEAAHDRGIVHRDLKPANVMITPDGHIKILDFGLAKAYQDGPAASDDASQSPTVTKGTELGVILGTASYMSPEQARGKLVDKRADLWAFGCCLYEALTGQKAWVGETTTDTLAALVNNEPDWNALPAQTPTSVRRLLERCLTKKVRERLTDAGMARIELSLPEADANSVIESRAPQRSGILLLAAAFVLVTAAAVLAWWLRTPPAAEILRVSISTPPGLTLDISPNHFDIDISPDGEWVAYIAKDNGRRRLYLRALQDFEPRVIDPERGNPRNPRFSADSKSLGYVLPNGQIRRVPVTGGRPETVCETGAALSFDWDGSGGVIFTRPASWDLRHCAPGDVEVTTLTDDYRERGISHRAPHTLPDRSAVLLSSQVPGEDRQLAVLPLGQAEPRLLGVMGTSPRYLSSGHIIYSNDGGLRAIEFDLSRLEVTGESFPLLDGVVTKGALSDFAIADDGTLIYVAGEFGALGNAGERTLLWVDRDGRSEPVAAQPAGYTRIQISPDGTRVALEIRAADADVWVWNIDRETMTRVTFDPGTDGQPIWLSNERLLFESHRTFEGNVFEKAADGTGAATHLVEALYHQVPLSVSPDGKWILFEDSGDELVNADIVRFSREAGTVEPILATEFRESAAAISPDGRFMAYHSNESGQQEVYVRPFPNVHDAKWPISSTGGSDPVWSRDNSELFFLDAERRLSVVDVQTTDAFSTSRPRRILERSFRVFSQRGHAYDVSPDGTRFMTFGEDQEVSTVDEIHVVLNWFEELERLAAAAEND